MKTCRLSVPARLISLFAFTAILTSAATKPKLVVAIVVDQFRYDYLLRFRDQYNSGLSRLLREGAVFTDAHYIHAATVTAVGHSTFLTGATPSVSGIIANEWYDRETANTVTSVSDGAVKLLGGIPGRTGSSPHRMLVSTVGDELKMRNGSDSKVFSISLKDRSAVLPGGHMADGAFWFDPDSNHWVTSTYYMPALPAWVQAINDGQPMQRYLGAEWFPLGAHAESATPLCTMVAGRDVRFCSLEATPWANELIEELAEHALTGEHLGQHSGTDILAVSFSGNDYVGHAVGPDDPAVRDISVRTDRLFGKLFDAVENAVGAGNTLVVMTADHGVAPVPEVNRARKMPGGRLSDPLFVEAINAALGRKFGPGNWLMPGPAFMPYLNLKLIREKALDRTAVERAAADAASAFPHIARVYTRTQLLNGNVQQDPISRAVSLGFYGPRSADLVVLPEPYYLLGGNDATTHGTPYDYDNHVPVIFMGPGIKAGTYRERIAVNDIAPTLAEILGVERPSGSMGNVLREILE